jgi:hypothetical protein
MRRPARKRITITFMERKDQSGLDNMDFSKFNFVSAQLDTQPVIEEPISGTIYTRHMLGTTRFTLILEEDRRR